jgi:chemotaxis protein methyltransferase CheR
MVQARHRSYLGGSLASREGTDCFGAGRRRRWPFGKAHAERQATSIPLSVPGNCLGTWRLCLDAADSHEPEAYIHRARLASAATVWTLSGEGYIGEVNALESVIMTNTQTRHLILAKAVQFRLFGKSPASFYLRVNELIWNWLPSQVHGWPLMHAYGEWLHTLVCLQATRRQFFGTFFLRNRPALELIRRLCGQKVQGGTVRIAVLGCSIGAEVYSILWTIRSARPDLRVILQAVDIAKEILEFAERGVFDPDTCVVVGSLIFERLTAAEKQEMFDWEGSKATVKPWLREGVSWRLGDVTDPELVNVLGLHDIVVGSNFLCHMAPTEADISLRNMSRLVEAGGYLLVTGVDLDVRTKIAFELGWKPIPDLMAEIHNGDVSLRADWPWRWWGLEPLNERRSDWETRYAAVFQVPGRSSLQDAA